MINKRFCNYKNKVYNTYIFTLLKEARNKNKHNLSQNCIYIFFTDNYNIKDIFIVKTYKHI